MLFVYKDNDSRASSEQSKHVLNTIIIPNTTAINTSTDTVTIIDTATTSISSLLMINPRIYDFTW